MWFPTWTSFCSWLCLENTPLHETLNGTSDWLHEMQTRQLLWPCRDCKTLNRGSWTQNPRAIPTRCLERHGWLFCHCLPGSNPQSPCEPVGWTSLNPRALMETVELVHSSLARIELQLFLLNLGLPLSWNRPSEGLSLILLELEHVHWSHFLKRGTTTALPIQRHCPLIQSHVSHDSPCTSTFTGVLGGSHPTLVRYLWGACPPPQWLYLDWWLR